MFSLSLLYPVHASSSSTSSTIPWTIIFQFARLHFLQILVFFALSCLTYYRRECSCNHVYATQVSGSSSTSNSSSSSSSSSDSSSASSSSTAASARNGSSRFRRTSSWVKNWDEDAADTLLEGAGWYFSGGPLLTAILSFWTMLVSSVTVENPWELFRNRHCRRIDGTDGQTDGSNDSSLGGEYLTRLLPGECQVTIMSFLHPKDVVTFACVNRTTCSMVDNKHGNYPYNSISNKASTAATRRCEISAMLWKTLWERDYAWIVKEWEVGKQALQRSLVGVHEDLRDDDGNAFLESVIHFNRDFYFSFGLTYTNYVLAGHNVHSSCLVGLHGAIYDMTSFLELHPGSPDVVMVEAGRDATEFFEPIGHSIGARKLTSHLCVAVDRLCLYGRDGGECGVQRIQGLLQGVSVPLRRSKPRRPGSLWYVKEKIHEEEQFHTQRAQQLKETHNVLGNVKTYFDPFTGKWKIWYTDATFHPVFVES